MFGWIVDYLNSLRDSKDEGLSYPFKHRVPILRKEALAETGDNEQEGVKYFQSESQYETNISKNNQMIEVDKVLAVRLCLKQWLLSKINPGNF